MWDKSTFFTGLLKNDYSIRLEEKEFTEELEIVKKGKIFYNFKQLFFYFFIVETNEF